MVKSADHPYLRRHWPYPCTKCFIYYCNSILQITQPFQYRCTQLQYRFAVISDSPSTYDINYDTVDHDTMSPKQNGSRNIRTDEKTRSYNAKLQSSAAHKTF